MSWQELAVFAVALAIIPAVMVPTMMVVSNTIVFRLGEGQTVTAKGTADVRSCTAKSMSLGLAKECDALAHWNSGAPAGQSEQITITASRALAGSLDIEKRTERNCSRSGCKTRTMIVPADHPYDSRWEWVPIVVTMLLILIPWGIVVFLIDRKFSRPKRLERKNARLA